MRNPRPKIAVETEDRRAEGDALTNDAKHFAGTLINKGLTVQDLGSEKAPLRREGDNRDAMVSAVRKEYAKAANFTVAEESTGDNPLEKLNDVEKACLEEMKSNFFRDGIALIDENLNQKSYEAALKKDPSAGQSWEIIQKRLLDNEATLLKKAVELSKLTGNQEGEGVILVGVYENGDLAIRQRSSEIVNARWTKNWKDGVREESEKGELVLLFHPIAYFGSMGGSPIKYRGRWAKPIEIIIAVENAGYHVPADVEDRNPYHQPVLGEKKGLVAAYEAITYEPYVKNDRLALLQCPYYVRYEYAGDDFDFERDDYSDAEVYVVEGRNHKTFIDSTTADSEDPCCGAILWLRG